MLILRVLDSNTLGFQILTIMGAEELHEGECVNNNWPFQPESQFTLVVLGIAVRVKGIY